MDRELDHPQRSLERPETLSPGEVMLRERWEGWSRLSYGVTLRHYVMVPGSSPWKARIDPSMVLALVPRDGLLLVQWPLHEIRCHYDYAPAHIIVTDYEPQLPDQSGDESGHEFLAMPNPDLTEEKIAMAIAKADARVCG